MSTRYIGCARRGERVDAQDKHRLVREVAIQSRLVVEEVGPVLLLQLRRARSDSQTLIASTKSVGELRFPAARHLLEIRAVAGDIPRLAPEDLDATVSPVSVEGRNGVAQRRPGVLLGERRGNHPDAHLVALQTGFEKRDANFLQVFLPLVEEGDVPPPRHISEKSQPRLSHQPVSGPRARPARVRRPPSSTGSTGLAAYCYTRLPPLDPRSWRTR